MKILIVTQYYLPDFGAPSFRMASFAEAFIDKGHEVNVICAEPNRYAGLTNEDSKKRMEKVVRLPIAQSNSKLQKKINWMRFSSRIGKEVAKHSKRHDLVICTSPPLTVPMAVRNRTGHVPVILDVRDLWPKALIDAKTVVNRLEISFLRRQEIKIYQMATHIICTSPAYANYLSRFKETTTVMNGVDTDWYEETKRITNKVVNEARKKIGLSDQHVLVTYSGNIGVGQDLRFVVEAAAKLDERVKFCLIGDGDEKDEIQKIISSRGLDDKVMILPVMNRLETVKYLKASDMLLINLLDTDAHREAVPSKIFEYTVIGRPIIAGLKGVAAEILLESETDVRFIRPSSEFDLIETIRNFRSAKGSNVEYNYNKFSRETQNSKLVALVEELFKVKKNRVK
ncbi:hypothetical protein DS67_00605 [Mesotoga sp. SC_4PWA21]|nr:hypothetical protein DS67_00605 [Mesotoga sp. SC_4PWA21]